MGKGSVDFGKVLFINASCTFSVKVTVNNCTLMVIRLPASNTDGTNACSVAFLSSFDLVFLERARVKCFFHP